jgi:hypothetical protein
VLSVERQAPMSTGTGKIVHLLRAAVGARAEREHAGI